MTKTLIGYGQKVHFLIHAKDSAKEMWISRMMGCVTMPSFSILINWQTLWYIHPCRGLRQRDHLLPYLFLLCAEGFTSLLAKAELEGRINGVAIYQRVLKISNLLFADNSLLFCQATHSEVEVITEILQTYVGALGHSINLEKSLVYFSSITQGRQKEEIMAALGVKEVEQFESYLGLPTLIERAKYQTFSYLKDRVWKKL